MKKISVNDINVHKISELLGSNGYQARLVGGAVRDLMMGIIPSDIDLATDAIPEEVLRIAEQAGHRVIPTGLQHGTVTVVLEGEGYEITTLRRDVATDGRHATVDFVTDFQTDAARRDFTFNAMSASVDGEVYDYFGGASDLRNRKVKFVGDAQSRITEDYLRILRFFRFRGRFGGCEDANDLKAIARHSRGLESISVERIWSEISKIITGPAVADQVRDMSRLGILKVIGWDFMVETLPTMEAVALAGGRPGTVLGAVSEGPEMAETLAKLWRLSGSETKDAIVASIVATTIEDDPYFWIGQATDGMSPDRMIPVLEATGRSSAAIAVAGEIPRYPLSGRDLKGIVDTGPEMGAALSQAKDIWKKSRFTLSKEELIDMISSGVNDVYERKP